MLKPVIMSALAGLAGTGLGGVMGLIFGRKGSGATCHLISFAAGVMLSVAFSDLIPEALMLSDIYAVIAAIAMGVVCVRLLNALVNRLSVLGKTPAAKRRQNGGGFDQPGRNRPGMLRSGLLMFFAIALHNFPEGMAIGSGGVHSEPMGIALAILIGLHDIPEGISVAVPLIEGGVGRAKAVAITALSGLPTLFGGFVGALIGGAGDIYVAIALGVAAGAMIYVTVCEMLPQALKFGSAGHTATFTVVGALFGLVIVQSLK